MKELKSFIKLMPLIPSLRNFTDCSHRQHCHLHQYLSKSCRDNDSDGLCNEVETNTGKYISQSGTGTDPNRADTDNDGLNDGVEVTILGTNPILVDTDKDSIPVGEEDSDNDGVTNVDEITCGSDPLSKYSKCAVFLPFLMLLLE